MLRMYKTCIPTTSNPDNKHKSILYRQHKSYERFITPEIRCTDLTLTHGTIFSRQFWKRILENKFHPYQEDKVHSPAPAGRSSIQGHWNILQIWESSQTWSSKTVSHSPKSLYSNSNQIVSWTRKSPQDWLATDRQPCLRESITTVYEERVIPRL
jgi:hypothetical protein